MEKKKKKRKKKKKKKSSSNLIHELENIESENFLSDNPHSKAAGIELLRGCLKFLEKRIMFSQKHYLILLTANLTLF